MDNWSCRNRWRVVRPNDLSQLHAVSGRGHQVRLVEQWLLLLGLWWCWVRWIGVGNRRRLRHMIEINIAFVVVCRRRRLRRFDFRALKGRRIWYRNVFIYTRRRIIYSWYWLLDVQRLLELLHQLRSRCGTRSSWRRSVLSRCVRQRAFRRRPWLQRKRQWRYERFLLLLRHLWGLKTNICQGLITSGEDVGGWEIRMVTYSWFAVIAMTARRVLLLFSRRLVIIA